LPLRHRRDCGHRVVAQDASPTQTQLTAKPQMTSFSGVEADLEQAASYELDALEFVRATLFSQTEVPANELRINLADRKNDEARYPATIGHVSTVSMSDQAVRAALSRLRPLAFVTAFKLQDMIAEWILRANGSTAWAFKAKLKDYDTKNKSGTLHEPDVFVHWPLLSTAFWELYKALTPFRSAVVHASGFSIHSDNALEIWHNTQSLRLSDSQQASYIRAMCLLTKQLLNKSPFSGLREAMVASDFSTLAPIHHQAGFTHRPIRFESMHVNLPSSASKSGPFESMVDFGELTRQAAATFPTASNGVLFLQLIIKGEDSSRLLAWSFPPESIPTGKVVIREGDPAYDKYLVVRAK
jgi:hypothetical protein